MSDTNKTEATGNAPVCLHDAASVSPREGSWEGPQGGQGEVTQSPEAEKNSPEVAVPEHAESGVHDRAQPGDGESGLENIASDCEENKSLKTENPEGCVQFDISCELGGVSTDIKTAFKDVQSELLSAVSEVKSELSHVLQSSTQFCLGASDQEGTNGGNSKNPEDNVMLIKDESEASEHPVSVRDIVIHKGSATESHLEKEDSLVFNFKDSNSLIVTGSVRDEPNRSECNSARERESLEHHQEMSSKATMTVKTDTSVEKDEEKDDVFTSFGLHDELGKNIAIEVTEDFLKEKTDSLSTVRIRKEQRFEVNKVFAVQSRLTEECESNREESSSHLVCHSGDEQGQKAQPLSAPSTPVPSASATGRKSLRTACRGRRVSFPEDETHLISSYLEPVNPWQQMAGTTVEEISVAYRASCERHRTQPLPGVLQQIKALPLVLGGRVECLSLRAQRLDSSQCEGLEEIFRRVQFKILDLEGCCLEDDTAIPLFDMIEFYDSATQLNISCNDRIGFRGWQACSRMLKRTPSVEYLDARNTNLNETNMPILSRALRLGSRLHTLHLESCNLTGRPLIMLTAALRQNEILTELYLADNRLGVNDCIQLSNLVRANSTLHLLDLRNNNVQDAGCSHVCEGITEQQKQQQQGEEGGEKSRSRGLRSLVLWNNHLTPQAAPHLANMLATTRALETLNLGRNNLTSEGILRLKESLLRNHALLRLGLQTARIGDEGAVALAEYTADNRVIQHVDLRDNPIHVAGLLALAHSLRLNSTVIQMDIDSDCRSEPSAELAEQHISLQKEIKEICQRNLTQSHLKASSQAETETPEAMTSKPAKKDDMQGGVTRKNSLTCDTTVVASREFCTTEVVTREEEKQKYVSPAPSPVPSPCPSPCPSPSPSPVPSPLRNNRFRVFKVAESSKSSPNLIASTSQPTIGCNAIHVSQSGRSMSAGDLTQAPKQKGVRPNRFGIGGRFTVTRVAEPCSLPSTQEASSFTLSSSYTSANTGSAPSPKIVISSPVRVERGFSVDETVSKDTAEKSEEKQRKCDPSGAVDFKTTKLPEDALQSGQVRYQSNFNVTECTNLKKCSSESPRQELSPQKSFAVLKNNAESQKGEKDCDSPNLSELTDSGFLDEGGCGRSSGSVSPSPSSSGPHSIAEGDRDSLLSSSVDSTNQEDTGLGPPMQESEPASPVLPCGIQQFDVHSVHDPPKRAPLAAMENGSFDSDSEDSELMTQSSDSTHSDEVRITTEQFEPKPAWGSKPEQPQISVASEAVAASVPTESG